MHQIHIHHLSGKTMANTLFQIITTTIMVTMVATTVLMDITAITKSLSIVQELINSLSISINMDTLS